MENAKQKLEERESSRDKQETKRQESTSREAQEIMPALVQQRKDLADFLKAGGKSGITNDFGKQSFFDSGKKNAKVSASESKVKHTDSAPPSSPDKVDSAPETTLPAKPLRLSELRAAQQKEKAQGPAADQTVSSSKFATKDSALSTESRTQNQLSSNEAQVHATHAADDAQKNPSDSAERKEASPKQYSVNRETFAHMQEMINQRRQLMNELKAGGRSGVTADFGKQEIFDSEVDSATKHVTGKILSKTEAAAAGKEADILEASKGKSTALEQSKPPVEHESKNQKHHDSMAPQTDRADAQILMMHDVKAKETVVGIARSILSQEHAPTPKQVIEYAKQIAEQNQIDPDKIRVGDKLTIPVFRELSLKELKPEAASSEGVKLSASPKQFTQATDSDNAQLSSTAHANKMSLASLQQSLQPLSPEPVLRGYVSKNDFAPQLHDSPSRKKDQSPEPKESITKSHPSDSSQKTPHHTKPSYAESKLLKDPKFLASAHNLDAEIVKLDLEFKGFKKTGNSRLADFVSTKMSGLDKTESSMSEVVKRDHEALNDIYVEFKKTQKYLESHTLSEGRTKLLEHKLLALKNVLVDGTRQHREQIENASDSSVHIKALSNTVLGIVKLYTKHPWLASGIAGAEAYIDGSNNETFPETATKVVLATAAERVFKSGHHSADHSMKGILNSTVKNSRGKLREFLKDVPGKTFLDRTLKQRALDAHNVVKVGVKQAADKYGKAHEFVIHVIHHHLHLEHEKKHSNQSGHNDNPKHH